jgi:hypothetical protein
MGYAYSGDEYWQTFEAETPSWAEYGDDGRQYVRRQFRLFTDTFGGATPSGAWARHFSIICWPITHAVLPTDLQRYLARLLFEYRSGLTSALLGDPAELGRRLAGRAWQASSRFQNFAQNTELLGQVAAALLVGDDEKSPYLLDSTLSRIVEDLSEERQARRWLRDAKASASSVRVRGLGRTGGEQSTGSGERANRDRLPAATDPELSLRLESAGWATYIEFPDLAALGERLPAAYEELGRLRARISGVEGAPLARGRLLVPGQQIRLAAWPADDEALVSLENGSPQANSLLQDQCVLRGGSRWLFRLVDSSNAAEVRGPIMRPDRSYVLVSRYELPDPLPSWIQAVPITTEGTSAYSIEVPPVLDTSDHDLVQRLGLAIATEIDVRPVGLAPALWDGEGTAEWNAGDDPMLAVSSTREAHRCIAALDADPHILAWPPGESELFLQLGNLDVGTHELRVALLANGEEQPLAEGALRVIVRTPPTPRSTGTFRQGLMLVTSPTAPTLTELWDGKAGVEIRGPDGARAKVLFTLGDRNGKVLARHGVSADLPIQLERWPNLFRQIREAPEIQRSYEESETAEIEASAPQLGWVCLRSEREFTPLRWVFRRDTDGPFVRLIDNTDGAQTNIAYSPFTTPDREETIDAATGVEFRNTAGGLLRAASPAAHASVILPPFVHTLDDLRQSNELPRLITTTRSSDGLIPLVSLAERWAAASLPADAIASIRRTVVLRAITAHVVAVVCGDRWQRLEQKLLEGREPAMTEFREAIGSDRYQRELALDLSHQIDRYREGDMTRRCSKLTFALRTHARRAGVRSDEILFAEFLLRLASDPATLATWPREVLRMALQQTLASPVLLRAARYVVLAVGQGVDSARPDVLYDGWVWE